jgi:pimeloyl-ACP methyl ester carboxylesterase
MAARGWRTLAVDWLSHGQSDQLPHEEWLRRDIVAVRHEIEIACAEAVAATGQSPVLVGHSMGGLASLAYAASTLRELAALVLLTPVVPRQYAAGPVSIEVDFDQPWGPPPPDIARQLFYSGADDVTAEACYQQLQGESPAAVWQATRWTAEVDVSTVRALTLAVAAEDDLLVPADYVLALADDMGAERILLPGVGHGVMLDPGWPELAARIEAWLVTVL